MSKEAIVNPSVHPEMRHFFDAKGFLVFASKVLVLAAGALVAFAGFKTMFPKQKGEQT
jgi:hypothetical protein